MAQAQQKLRVRISLVVDVDVESWRQEYGSTDSRMDIREVVRESIVDAARQAYPTSTFGTMVSLHEAERGL